MNTGPFSEFKLKDIYLKNRFVRSATWEGMATETGEVTPKLIKLMEDLARGEVGLIITGHAYVDPIGQASPWQLGVHRDELISSLEKIPQAVHKFGSKVFLQIAHSGIFAFNLEKKPGLGPSPLDIHSDFRSAKGVGMTKKDIKEVITKFGEAALRAKKAGFDGIQIHAAHGYLLSQFLSPYFNKRNDEYGGDIRARSKLVLEVYQRIREMVDDFPVIIKLNAQDFLDPGMSFDEMLYVSKLLEENGIDGIEMSGGTLISKEFIPSRTKKIAKKVGEIYYMEHALRFKQKTQVPLILVGGIRRFNVCEKLISKGVCDLISMSRPFIREPYLIRRWKQGDLRDALCESDNLCFKPALMGEGIYCYLEKKIGKNKEKTIC